MLQITYEKNQVERENKKKKHIKQQARHEMILC